MIKKQKTNQITFKLQTNQKLNITPTKLKKKLKLRIKWIAYKRKVGFFK